MARREGGREGGKEGGREGGREAGKRERDISIYFNYAGSTDYNDILPVTRDISRQNQRQCFRFITVDDDVDEEPEHLAIRGTPISHLIEFTPDSAVIWIIDDESKLYALLMMAPNSIVPLAGVIYIVRSA